MRTVASRTLGLAFAAIIVSVSAVMAHHGIGGRYDTGTPVLLVGEVTGATFSPPHPVISVRVEMAEAKFPAGAQERTDEFTGPLVVRPQDVGQVREIEFSPVRTFYNLEGRVKVGDRIVVLALRNCDPPHQLRSSWIQLSGGDVISYAGGLHRRVEGCA